MATLLQIWRMTANFVGDQYHGDAQLGVDLLEQFQNALGGHGVQRAGGLVAQEHFRVAGQRPGDGHPLLLAAGQLGGVGVGLFFQTDDLKQLHHPLVCLLLGRARDLQRVAHVPGHVLLHQQVELLEDHRHAAAGLQKLLFAHGQNVLTVDQHLSVGRRVQSVQAADQCALARTAHADNAVNVALLDGQVDVVQRLYLAAGDLVDLAEPPQFDLRHSSLLRLHSVHPSFRVFASFQTKSPSRTIARRA